jgi:uncharacterized protein DUF3330
MHVTGNAAMDKRSDLQYSESSLELASDATDAPVTLERISCWQAFLEIPLSEALVPEALDYVVYFCGLDCYELWRNQAEALSIGDPERGCDEA